MSKHRRIDYSFIPNNCQVVRSLLIKAIGDTETGCENCSPRVEITMTTYRPPINNNNFLNQYVLLLLTLKPPFITTQSQSSLHEAVSGAHIRILDRNSIPVTLFIK